MDFFETPSWDGPNDPDNLTHDLFRPHAVSRVKVAKKRKRNKYPKASVDVEIPNSLDCPTEEKVTEVKKSKKSEKRKKINPCDQGIVSKGKAKFQDESELKNKEKVQSKNSDSPMNKSPPDSNRDGNVSQVYLGSNTPSSPMKRRKKKKKHEASTSNDDKNKLRSDHNLKKIKGKLNLSMKINSPENKSNENLFIEANGQKQDKSKRVVKAQVNGNTCGTIKNKKKKILVKESGDVMPDNLTKKKKRVNSAQVVGKNFSERIDCNHSLSTRQEKSEHFTQMQGTDVHASSPLPQLDNHSSHKTKKLKKKKNDLTEIDSETSKGSPSQLPKLAQSTQSKKRKHAVNNEAGNKKKKIAEEGHSSLENLASQSKNLPAQGLDVLNQAMEPNHVGGSKVSYSVLDNDTSPGGPKKKLTLREKMMDKLRGSRFRFLNEQMYNSKSEETRKFFVSDQKSFEAYHEGYKQQLMHWPMKPVDAVIKYLKKKPTNCIIADFGCGDAQIAQSLPNQVHSFDYVALNDTVTACDMAHTPLTNSSVDVAVFCLSLMGSNLSDYIREANRVLKVGGILKIAEVESRFDNVEKFIRVICKYGFLCIGRDLSKDVFFIFDFKKENNIKDGKSLPPIELRACSYKKR